MDTNPGHCLPPNCFCLQIQPPGGPHRKYSFQQFFCCCVCKSVAKEMCLRSHCLATAGCLGYWSIAIDVFPSSTVLASCPHVTELLCAVSGNIELICEMDWTSSGCAPQSGNALDLYSVGIRFESRLSHRLYWLRTVVISLSLPSKFLPFSTWPRPRMRPTQPPRALSSGVK
jgi:hypothetical protein